MPTTVTEYLSDDHRRLDAIVPEVQDAATSGAHAQAAAAFVRFAEGLNRHIRAEEEVLFPAFEKATGMVAGPIGVMRAEHAELRRLLSSVSSALGAGDGAEALRILQALKALLAEHNMKEEKILYPMTDRSLRDASELVANMRSIIQGVTK